MSLPVPDGACLWNFYRCSDIGRGITESPSLILKFKVDDGYYDNGERFSPLRTGP